MKSWSTLQQGRFFSYLGDLGLGAFQWSCSLVPTWGLTQNSLNANCVHFLGILMPETNFWCMLNLLENMLNAGFLCTIVLVCENWIFFFSVCMCFIL